MLSLTEAAQRTESFLTGQMLSALRAVDYPMPRFDAKPQSTSLADAARARVEVRHLRGASDCFYLIEAFGDALLMQLQLNVWRLVVVYRVPALHGLDASGLEPRLQRWQFGANHAGWTIGWRDAADPHDRETRFVETYCYAKAEPDFLADEVQQLYWRTDIVQMTRYFMLESQRCGVRLSPRGGIPLAKG